MSEFSFLVEIVIISEVCRDLVVSKFGIYSESKLNIYLQINMIIYRAVTTVTIHCTIHTISLHSIFTKITYGEVLLIT